MNNGLVRFTKRLLDMMFYAGIILTIMIPVAFHYVGFYIEVYRKYYIPVSYTHLDVYKRQLWNHV